MQKVEQVAAEFRAMDHLAEIKAKCSKLNCSVLTIPTPVEQEI
jgi:hypothetical protein